MRDPMFNAHLQSPSAARIGGRAVHARADGSRNIGLPRMVPRPIAHSISRDVSQ